MNVYIARDGEILGEYPHQYLERWAREGYLDAYDDYWHEGMEGWLPITELIGPEIFEPPPPPLPPPQAVNRRVLIGSIAAAVVVAGILAFALLRTNRPGQAHITSAEPRMDEAAEVQLRDKAAADLRQRIERLPATAKPPLNTFYYDVRVNMRKTFNRETPWSATIHGWANVIDPATDQTVSRTDFVLTTDYVDGDWVYKNYRATVNDLINAISQGIEEGEYSLTTPDVAGILGLKRSYAENSAELEISKVPPIK